MVMRFAVFALTFAVIAPLHAESAQEMLSACRPIARADVSGDYAKFDQDFETGTCWGAFSVIQQMTRWGRSDRDRLLDVCAPLKSRLTQFIAIFVRYAEEKPQRLHEDFSDVALDSLRGAFPCSGVQER